MDAMDESIAHVRLLFGLSLTTSHSASTLLQILMMPKTHRIPGSLSRGARSGIHDCLEGHGTMYPTQSTLRAE